MSDEKQLSQVHTTCRNCVFAKWDEGTQIGCKLNKLDDYKEAGIEVLDATDNELQFNVINGRFCVFYRNEQLMANVPRDNWEKIVKLQTKVPYHAILIVDEETDFRSIKESCKMLAGS